VKRVPKITASHDSQANFAQYHSNNGCQMSQAQFWLVVESPKNWEIDQRDGFTSFGIGEKKQKLANRIQKGDTIFVYVPGRGCFSDIRRATQSGVRKLPGGGSYDRPYPLCISTEPVLTLSPDKWVPVREVKDRLPLLRGREHWSPMLQVSLREISAEDASVLQQAMNALAPGSATHTQIP
jgi:hypothetical protein